MLASLMAQQRKEKVASAQRAKDFFARLGEGAQDAQTVPNTTDMVVALGANPFKQRLVDLADGPLGGSAGNQAREADKTMLEKGLDLVTQGLGPGEKLQPRL